MVKESKGKGQTCNDFTQYFIEALFCNLVNNDFAVSVFPLNRSRLEMFNIICTGHDDDHHSALFLAVFVCSKN